VPFEHPALSILSVLALTLTWIPIASIVAHALGFISIGSTEDLDIGQALKQLVAGERTRVLWKVFERALILSVLTTVVAAVLVYALLRMRVARTSLWLALAVVGPVLLNPICRVEGLKQAMMMADNLIGIGTYGESAVRVGILSNTIPFTVGLLYYGLSERSRRQLLQHLSVERLFLAQFFLVFLPLVKRALYAALVVCAVIVFGLSTEAGGLGVAEVSIDRMIADLAGGQQFMIVTAVVIFTVGVITLLALLVGTFFARRPSKMRFGSFRLHVIELFAMVASSITCALSAGGLTPRRRWLIGKACCRVIVSIFIVFSTIPFLFMVTRSLRIVDAGRLQMSKFNINGYLAIGYEEKLMKSLVETTWSAVIASSVATLLAFALGSLLWRNKAGWSIFFLCGIASLAPAMSAVRGWHAVKRSFGLEASSWCFFYASEVCYVLPFCLASVLVMNCAIDSRLWLIAREYGATRTFASFGLLPRLSRSGLAASFLCGFLLVSGETVRALSLCPSGTKAVGHVIMGLIKAGGDGAERAYATGTLLSLMALAGIVVAWTIAKQEGKQT
jgi:ABC-type spermidine/putrescine transport system permease subunit II